MEDTLKSNNPTLPEKPITEADIKEAWLGREMVNLLQHGLAKGLKLMWFQLLFSVALMMVLLAALILVLTRIPSTGNIAAPDFRVAEKNPPAPAAARPANITETPPPTTALVERQEIQAILDRLRQAQLAKDINLFFDAYSPTFPNLAAKKEGILKTWQKYKYLDLNFNLASIQKKDAHTIVAEIACDTTLEDILSKKQRNLESNFNIYFSNVSGKWLIQGLTEGKKTRELSGLSLNKGLLSLPLNHLP